MAGPSEGNPDSLWQDVLITNCGVFFWLLTSELLIWEERCWIFMSVTRHTCWQSLRVTEVFRLSPLSTEESVITVLPNKFGIQYHFQKIKIVFIFHDPVLFVLFIYFQQFNYSRAGGGIWYHIQFFFKMRIWAANVPTHTSDNTECKGQGAMLDSSVPMIIVYLYVLVFFFSSSKKHS